MIEWIAVVILGIVEGLTEFLPVSSTGHLLLTGHLLKRVFGLAPRSDMFNTVIQSGAVLAVAVLFTQRARKLIFRRSTPGAWQFLLKLIVAVLITGVGGIILVRRGFKLPDEARPVAWATLVGGFAILGIERWVKGRTLRDDISWAAAVTVGLAQVVAAVFPGTSRSAATILVAIALGATRPAATEFSFLVGIPTLFLAGTLQVFNSLHHAVNQAATTPENWAHLMVASLAAAGTAFLVVRVFLHFVQTRTFAVFGWYRIAVGLLILVLLYAFSVS